MSQKYTVELKKLIETEVSPEKTRLEQDGTLFIDFGKAAFASLIIPAREDDKSFTVHLGEKLDDSGKRIDRNPPGNIRYNRVEQKVIKGSGFCRIIIPHDTRNTGPDAIKMPDYIGEVMPFRYAEIENGQDIDIDSIRQVFVHYPFDDNAASFKSSDNVLNAVWDICKYSIKATTFCGLYVDGDRERIPYEGDAYINQLGHYCMDQEYDFARYSHEYLIQNPTWCTEWHMHSVMMAWMDYMYSGEKKSLEVFYKELCVKTLIDFAREDGLISVSQESRTPEINGQVAAHIASGIIKENIRDIVDWPPASFTNDGTGERDNHEMMPVNTVVNAFHCYTLELMSRIAGVLSNKDDMRTFKKRAKKVKVAINKQLFDTKRGIYVDGEGSSHSSLHSNMFMLAFNLVPKEYQRPVVDFVKSRDMACSVYGAQYLLEGLYLNGEDNHALKLISATHDRSWWNMIQAGSTITLEAWDIKYKNNLDWNHAWGAVPGNIIARYLLGVRPLEPGFSKVLINPQPGSLKYAKGAIPTPYGSISVRIKNTNSFELNVEIPNGMTAEIKVPESKKKDAVVTLNGQIVD